MCKLYFDDPNKYIIKWNKIKEESKDVINVWVVVMNKLIYKFILDWTLIIINLIMIFYWMY